MIIPPTIGLTAGGFFIPTAVSYPPGMCYNNGRKCTARADWEVLKWSAL